MQVTLRCITKHIPHVNVINAVYERVYCSLTCKAAWYPDIAEYIYLLVIYSHQCHTKERPVYTLVTMITRELAMHLNTQGRKSMKIER